MTASALYLAKVLVGAIVPDGSIGGDVVGPSSSIASEGVLFDGITGKLIKRATGTGIVHRTSGVDSVSNVVESEITTADNVTNDASTSKHGFVPKLPNDITKFYNGIGGFTIPASAAAAFSGASVFNSTTQTIPNATATVLTANSELYDTAAYHTGSGSRLTAPTTGYYLVVVTLGWASSSTGKRVVDFMINGSIFRGDTNDVSPSLANADAHHGTSDVLQLAAGDYVEVIVFQNSTGNLNVTLQTFTMSLLGL